MEHGTAQLQNVNVSDYFHLMLEVKKQELWFYVELFVTDARCVTLSDDKNDGLKVIRDDPESVLVPYRDNVTITCTSPGRELRNTVTSPFRQCVYDPKPVTMISFYYKETKN